MQLEKKKRGNQGWSTRGKHGSVGAGNQGWSTGPNAGRPKGDGPERKNHTIRANDEEFPLIKRFIALVRMQPEKAKKILDD